MSPDGLELVDNAGNHGQPSDTCAQRSARSLAIDVLSDSPLNYSINRGNRPEIQSSARTEFAGKRAPGMCDTQSDLPGLLKRY